MKIKGFANATRDYTFMMFRLGASKVELVVWFNSAEEHISEYKKSPCNNYLV